jgi:diaminopimelate decarboxylase
MSAFRTEIAGVSVVELARQFGTPTFVYDAAMIRRRIADLAAFDVVRYAQKACSNLAILDLVRRNGVLVDAVSAGEIRRALSAGYTVADDPPPIVYTADIFDAESLDLCVEHKIHVNCGSPDMIDQYGDRAGGEHQTLVGQVATCLGRLAICPTRAGKSPCGSIPASATVIAKKPTPAASRPSTASGTLKSPSASTGPKPIASP